MTLTGTLLALEAPVTGSGGSKPNGEIFDSHGWFKHWSKIAEERGVESLYLNQKVDLEAITAAQPDLIIASKTGGDSAMDQIEQLCRIAATVVIDYNNSDWREVTERVGEVVGRADKATTILSEFDQEVASVKKAIAVPKRAVDLASYARGDGLSVGLPTAPQAKVLTGLGITIKDTGVTPMAVNPGFGGALSLSPDFIE